VSGPVIYGGSAKPGLLTQLGDGVDGLFLGRFAHDPSAVAAILDEVVDLAEGGPRWRSA
jgi:triosephosphate isomerase